MPKEQRLKIDSESTLYMFIGYNDEEFGHRLWDSKEKKYTKLETFSTPNMRL